jgi:hypothetical protein
VRNFCPQKYIPPLGYVSSMADETKTQPDYCCAAYKKMTRGWQIMRDTVAGTLCLRVLKATIGAESVRLQVAALQIPWGILGRDYNPNCVALRGSHTPNGLDSTPSSRRANCTSYYGCWLDSSGRPNGTLYSGMWCPIRPARFLLLLVALSYLLNRFGCSEVKSRVTSPAFAFGAFRAATDTKNCGGQDMPHTPTSETPRVQHRHLGAVIAIAYRSVVSQIPKPGGICYGESVPPGFFFTLHILKRRA